MKGVVVMAEDKIKMKEGREVGPWRPFSGLTGMEQEVEKLFEDFWGRPFGWPERWRSRELKVRGPAIEVYEETGDVVVKAEIPGLKKEDLQVNLSDNLLTIHGEKKQEEEKKEKGYYYSERSYGSFSRSIQLPTDVQPEKVSASFKDGVLEIRLPKTEEAKRKEVKIKVV
jgi:HSP20 family protein